MWLSHRLAWVYTFSEWPPEMLDHRSGKRDDSALVNVRAATRSLNSRNKRRHRDGRLPGASRSGDRWCAQIEHDGRRSWLGMFDTEAEASTRYMEAAALRDAGLSFDHLTRPMPRRSPHRGRSGKWMAAIRHGGRDWYLGTFDTEGEAQARIDTAETLRDAGLSFDHLVCQRRPPLLPDYDRAASAALRRRRQCAALAGRPRERVARRVTRRWRRDAPGQDRRPAVCCTCACATVGHGWSATLRTGRVHRQSRRSIVPFSKRTFRIASVQT